MPYRRPVYTLTLIAALASAPSVLHAAGQPDGLADCRVKASDTDRLACYDSLAERNDKPGPAEVSTEVPDPAEVSTEVPDPATPPDPDDGDVTKTLSSEELFGLDAEEVQQSLEETSGTAAISELSALAAGVQTTGHGRAIVTLDNGQVWRQISSPSLRIRVGDTIIIRKAAFGSYKMNIEGSARAMRVRREK